MGRRVAASFPNRLGSSYFETRPTIALIGLPLSGAKVAIGNAANRAVPEHYPSIITTTPPKLV